jgi:hypothetical protein
MIILSLPSDHVRISVCISSITPFPVRACVVLLAEAGFPHCPFLVCNSCELFFLPSVLLLTPDNPENHVPKKKLHCKCRLLNFNATERMRKIINSLAKNAENAITEFHSAGCFLGIKPVVVC